MKVVSWDGNVINDVVNYSSSLEVGAHTPVGLIPGVVPREKGPLVGGATTPVRYFVMRTVIASTADKRALQAQWYRWFWPERRRIGPLVVEDDDGSNERYVQALPMDITHDPDGDGYILLTTFVLHDEPAWRSVIEDTDTWAIIASGQTIDITNGSADRNEDAYPNFTITPNADKSSNQILGVFVPVRWRSNQAATNYPYDIANASFNTAALVTAGKMQADGDDIRVILDGEETDYWLHGMNTSATKIWCVLDFQPSQEFTLSATRSSGSTNDIAVSENIDALPSVGLVQIDSEIFSYSSKDNSARLLKGITPAAKNTSAAGHSSGATVVWIQHDITILYGDSSAAAYSSDAARKPIFNLGTSTNTSWVYEDFFEDGVSRPASWGFSTAGWSEKYGGNQHSAANPYGELGIATNAPGSKDYNSAWILYHPCGILGANFTNGQMFQAASLTAWTTGIRSSIDGNVYTSQYSIPKPTVVNTWQTWSQNVASLPASTRYIALWHQGHTTLNRIRKVECADVVVTLDSGRTPTSSIGSESNSYQLRATLSNLTTGEALQITFDMALGTGLQIATDEQRIVHLVDGSLQYRAVLPDDQRDSLLRLQPGINTLEWVDPGTTDVTLNLSWRKRWVN